VCTLAIAAGARTPRENTQCALPTREAEKRRARAGAWATGSEGSHFFSVALTYWTLAVELMLGMLVWNRTARPVVLALGVVLHVTVAR
jgi:hypothetical protein